MRERWVSGLRPALVAWGLATLAFKYYFTPPLDSLAVNLADELALRSYAWHHLEHACFLATAMLFWPPVILTWPARSPWPRWTMIP